MLAEVLAQAGHFLWQDDAKFGDQAMQSVIACGALCDKALPGAMQALCGYAQLCAVAKPDGTQCLTAPFDVTNLTSVTSRSHTAVHRQDDTRNPSRAVSIGEKQNRCCDVTSLSVAT